MAEGTELDKVYVTVDANLAPARGSFKQLDAEAGKAANNLQDHFKKATRGASELHRGVEVSRRELLYFGRELVAGDLQRLPGTLLLLGTHFAGVTTSAIIAGTAIVAPFVAVGLAAVKAQAAIDRVNRSLAATGNAAGLSAAQAMTLANGVSSPGLSVRGALDTESILASHGNIRGEESMRSATQASNALRLMTGGKGDDAAKEIEKLFADPAKGAQELNDQFKLLSRAETLHVDQLMASGKVADAQKILADALIKRGKDVDEAMNPLTKGFDHLETILSNLWFKFGIAASNAINPEFQMNPAQRASHELQQLLKARDAVQHQNVGGLFGVLPSAHNRELADLNGRVAAKEAELRKAMGDQSVKDGEGFRRQQQLQKDQQAQVANSPAALELQRLRDEARVARAPLRDRDALRTRLSAERDYRGNIEKGGLDAGFAAQIKRAQITAGDATVTASRRQALLNTQQSSSDASALAGAYRTSPVAGSRQEAANKAHEEFLKGSIDDEAAYAAALMRTADAEREVAAAKADLKRSDETAALELEIQLLNTDYDARQKQIALLKAKNDLIEQGFDLTTDAGKAELARVQAQVSAQQDLNKVIKDTNEVQQNQVSVAKDMVGVVGTIFDHANQGAQGLKSLLPDITKQLLGMIEKLTILNPLENAINKTFNPGADQHPLPTAVDFGKVTSKLFSGPASRAGKAAGGWLGGLFKSSAGRAAGVMARGPGGAASGASGGGGNVGVNQTLNIHPDVSSIARGEIVKMMPHIQNSTLTALNSAMNRGMVPGGMG